MKKRVLMIVMIIVGMLLMPRYLQNGRQIKRSQVHSLPDNQIQEPSDDFNLTFPGIWFLFSYVRLRPSVVHRA